MSEALKYAKDVIADTESMVSTEIVEVNPNSRQAQPHRVRRRARLLRFGSKKCRCRWSFLPPRRMISVPREER